MPHSTRPPLGLTLKLLRRARGWTQKDLAAAAGTTAAVISGYERGTRSGLDRERLAELAAVLGQDGEVIELALAVVESVMKVPAEEEGPVTASRAERRLAHTISLRLGLLATGYIETVLLRLAASRRRDSGVRPIIERAAGEPPGRPAGAVRGERGRQREPTTGGLEMADQPEELRVLAWLLRALRNCPQKEMAMAAGLDPGALAQYESGLVVPPRADLERLAAAARVPIHLVDSVLLPAIHAVCLARAHPQLMANGSWDEWAEVVSDEMTTSFLASVRAAVASGMMEIRGLLDAESAAAEEAISGGPSGPASDHSDEKPVKKPFH